MIALQRKAHIASGLAVFVSLLFLAQLPRSQMPVVTGTDVEQSKPSCLRQQQEPVRIGEVEITQLGVRYPGVGTPRQTISYGGAPFIQVHILSLALLPGDVVTVSDPLGRQRYTYPGVSDYTSDDGEGFWSLSIPGDTAVVELHSQYTDEELADMDLGSLGAFIDRFARGYSGAEMAEFLGAPESVCNGDDRRDVVCYETSHPTEYERAGTLARIRRISGMYVYYCTAWRVGPDDKMFTNEHCMETQSQLDASEVWFNYQSIACDGTSVADYVVVTGNSLIENDQGLDYALFTINDAHLVEGFGYLELDVRTPVLGEEIYIPQHSGGDRKELGIESDQNTGNVCRIDAVIRPGGSGNVDTGYYCDTSGGSSGSPVLARSSHSVLAIHHWGIPDGTTCPPEVNQGVRMEEIWPDVYASLIPGPELITVSMPADVTVGETFTVHVDARNDNPNTSTEGIINASVLYSTGGDDLALSNVSAPWADDFLHYSPGQGPLHDSACNEIPGGSVDHVVQATDLDWQYNEVHSLSFAVTPHQPGTLWVRVRNTMDDVRYGCHYQNDSDYPGQPSDLDQQGWSVARFPVNVCTEPPPTLTLSFPLDGSSTCDSRPFFDWATLDGAASYQIQLDNDPDFGSPETDIVWSNDRYKQSEPLTDGDYYWRVRGCNACGCGPWSETWSLSVNTADCTASFPFYDSFEDLSEELTPWWTTSTTAEGRVRVGGYYDCPDGYSCVHLDDSVGNTIYSDAAIILTIDLSGRSNVVLDFWLRDHGDESHDQDGVFLSDDGGSTWVKAMDFAGASQAWHMESVDLSAQAAASGLSLNSQFRIKFQFHDNYPTPTDGYSIDGVRIYEDFRADFSAAPIAGTAPLRVSYTNLSSGAYDTCSWDYGDGGSSTLCGDHGYTYSAVGTYTVSLTISGPGGVDEEEKPDYVSVRYGTYLPAVPHNH